MNENLLGYQPIYVEGNWPALQTTPGKETNDDEEEDDISIHCWLGEDFGSLVGESEKQWRFNILGSLKFAEVMIVELPTWPVLTLNSDRMNT